MTRSIRAQAPSLQLVQRRMAAHILAPPPDGRGGCLAGWLALPAGARPADRLAVYAGGYPARLHEALAEQFPALAHLAGGRRFAALVERYVATAGLRSSNLNDAGAALAAFLGGDELGAELPFVAALAELEWRVHRAFHAADGAPLDAGALAGWAIDDWAAARLRFQPSVALLRSDWPLRALWEARDTPREQIDIDLRGGDRVLVRRAGHAVRCESVADGEASALERLLGGEALGAVAETLADGPDGAAVGAWFARWLAVGMIAGIERSGAAA